ncbi:MAG: oligoendopeptidase F, partial [Candidatus Coproplasma sp.]
MERKDVLEKYIWKTEDIYASDEEWEKEYAWLYENINLSKYAGKLGNRADLLACLKESDEYSLKYEKLAYYAGLKHDEDARVSKYTSYDGKIGMLGVKFSQDMAFFEPEMASLDDE